MGSLSGRTVLVTGAARRIGRTLALRLSREGARVAVHYGGSAAEAESVARECGNGSATFQANLDSVPEITGLFADVQNRFGKLDALVNNAARFTKFDVMNITEADWDHIHSVNLKAVFFCCQQGAKLMRESPGGEGRIVNISSLGGIRPWADHVHYCASKAGVIHMTRALAKALAPGISVNSVAPGVIPFAEAGTEEIRRLVADTPAGRAGTADEIADAVLFFLTATTFITGQLMAVDGGLSQR